METTKTGTSSKGLYRRNAPQPIKTGSNRDWVMIVLGVLLIAFFIAAGYASLIETNKNSPLRKRGPVKYPKKLGYIDRSTEFSRTANALELSQRLRDYGGGRKLESTLN